MRFIFLFFVGLCLLSSCKIYNQNILFKTNGDVIGNRMEMTVSNLHKNYPLKKNDRIIVKVFTNKGEVLIDPKGAINVTPNNTNNSLNNNNNNNTNTATSPNNLPGQNFVSPPFNSYLVKDNGTVTLPMLGEVMVENLKINQVDSLLSIKYNQFYEESYVVAQCINNRIIVLKGDIGQVVPLLNEGMTVVEAIALTGGIASNLSGKKIRLIRGDLQNPTVYEIDLSTVDGMRRVSLVLQPNDIVYIEPVRKVFYDSFRDVAPILTSAFGFITSIITLVILLKK